MANEELVLNVPEGALIPEGATFYEGPDDGRCRLIKADGERCRAARTRTWGLCPGHAGRGGVVADPRAASQRAHEVKRQRRERRLLLGITAHRTSTPAQLSRLRAQERAEEIATALIDGPLDDADLGSLARQRAMLAALDHLYPQVSANLDVEVPVEPEGVSQLGWSDLSALAGRLLGEGHQGDTS